ncbi:7-cyano-7-deazaguanine synthase [Afipia felis]
MSLPRVRPAIARQNAEATCEGQAARRSPSHNLVFLTFAAIMTHQRDLKHVVTSICETDFSGYQAGLRQLTPSVFIGGTARDGSAPNMRSNAC